MVVVQCALFTTTHIAVGPLKVAVYVGRRHAVGLEQIVQHLVRVVFLGRGDARARDAATPSLTPLLRSVSFFDPLSGGLFQEEVVEWLDVAGVMTVARVVVSPGLVEAVCTAGALQSVEVPKAFSRWVGVGRWRITWENVVRLVSAVDQSAFNAKSVAKSQKIAQIESRSETTGINFGRPAPEAPSCSAHRSNVVWMMKNVTSFVLVPS